MGTPNREEGAIYIDTPTRPLEGPGILFIQVNNTTDLEVSVDLDQDLVRSTPGCISKRGVPSGMSRHVASSTRRPAFTGKPNSWLETCRFAIRTPSLFRSQSDRSELVNIRSLRTPSTEPVRKARAGCCPGPQRSPPGCGAPPYRTRPPKRVRWVPFLGSAYEPDC